MPSTFPPGFRPEDRQVYFRPVPGQRRFYISGTYEQLYSTYFVRRYRASRNEAERIELQNRSESRRRVESQQRSDFYQGFMLKKEHDLGRRLSREERQAARAEFYEDYRELRLTRFNINRMTNARQKHNALRKGSRMDQLLIKMGKRTGDEDFPVGMSPPGHSTNVVRPFLRLRD